MRQRFLEAADTIVELAAEDGFTVRPYLDRELPVFSSLAPAEAGYALTRIETMVGVCKFARARGERLQDSRAMLACYLEVSGSTTEPGVLDQIEDDHTLEIYSTDHKLVFAALKSLDVTSYSLEEIYCRPWTELLSRDVPGISEALYQVAQDLLTEKVTRIVPTASIPDHVCRETQSLEKRSIIVFHRFFAPVRRDQRVTGFLCVNHLFPHQEIRA